jgi:hypothetical protein
MFWPPDHDAIHFLVQADKRDVRDVDWDFSIPTADWRLATDRRDDVPKGLYADVKYLFRKVWRETSTRPPGPRAYLRLHESSSSIDLTDRCIKKETFPLRPTTAG